MKYLRKLAVLLFVVLAFIAMGCATPPEEVAEETLPLVAEEPYIAPEHHFFVEVDPVFAVNETTVEDKLIPWNEDAVQRAISTKSLLFYFMASEGTQVPGVGEKIGDSCLIVFPDGTTMLVDACQEPYYPQLNANLKALGITHLDYVQISHPHSDHYMGLVNPEGLTAEFTIGKVFYNGITNTGNTRILDICAEKSIPVQVLKEGDRMEIGGVTVEILNPTESVSQSALTSTADVNNSSICMLLSYGSKKALFTGDMYKAGMQELVKRYGSSGTVEKGKLNADFLKICHHGHSETSILQSFANAVSPEIALASSGIALNASVYESYASAGARVLGDYTEGYIAVSIDDQTINVRTSRTRTTDYYARYDKSPQVVGSVGKAVVSDYATGTFTVVSSAVELKQAVQAGEKNIRLGADIPVSAFSASNSPLVLDLTGVVLDMNGFSFTGCVSIVSEIVSKGQGCVCNLVFNGSDFAILNGHVRKSKDGGYGFQINPNSTDPLSRTNIVIDGMTFDNCGLDVRGSTVTLRNCMMTQPKNCTENFSTLMFTDSYVVIESGDYRNIANNTYQRWLKLANSKAYIKNGVDRTGTVLYSVEDSVLILERD